MEDAPALEIEGTGTACWPAVEFDEYEWGCSFSCLGSGMALSLLVLCVLFLDVGMGGGGEDERLDDDVPIEEVVDVIVFDRFLGESVWRCGTPELVVDVLVAEGVVTCLVGAGRLIDPVLGLGREGSSLSLSTIDSAPMLLPFFIFSVGVGVISSSSCGVMGSGILKDDAVEGVWTISSL